MLRVLEPIQLLLGTHSTHPFLRTDSAEQGGAGTDWLGVQPAETAAPAPASVEGHSTQLSRGGRGGRGAVCNLVSLAAIP